MNRDKSSTTATFAALAAAAALCAGGCTATDPVGELAQEGRGRPPAETAPAGDECTSEPGAPAAAAKVVIGGDPARATSATVLVQNLGAEDRHIRVGLRSHMSGERREAGREAMLVRAGASASFDFELAELGLFPSRLQLPARLQAVLVVETEDGSLVERIYSDRVQIGPDLDSAVGALLAAEGMRSKQILATGVRGLSAKLAAADQTDLILQPDASSGPDEEAGGALPQPTIDSGIPDENGLYHYNFCFRWPVSLVDAGFGEDFGLQPEGSWRARGGRMMITSHGEMLFNGYLDADGCTGTIDTPHSTDYWFVGYSFARIDGNVIIAKRADGATDAWVRLAGGVGGSGTKHYDLPDTDLSNLLAVAAFTVDRFGGISGETVVVNDRCRPDGSQCCDCASDDQIWISRKTRKFLIAHEVGHRILGIATGGYDNDCSLQVSQTLTPCYNASGHAIDSLEYSSCAAMEGWAHFVAVRTFNDHQGADAVLRYWRGNGLTVDVQQGPTGVVDRAYETLCGGSGLNAAGRGLEVDWMRQYWDYHTAPSPGYAPSQLEMIDEIAANPGWDKFGAYQFISDGIAATSGDGQEDRWTTLAGQNGMDH